MSFLPKSRTRRRLFKVASLGLAGLLAGLLSGCNSADASVRSDNSHAADHSLDASVSSGASTLPASIEARQIPALHHTPSVRKLQPGSLRTSAQSLPNFRNGY